MTSPVCEEVISHMLHGQWHTLDKSTTYLAVYDSSCTPSQWQLISTSVHTVCEKWHYGRQKSITSVTRETLQLRTSTQGDPTGKTLSMGYDSWPAVILSCQWTVTSHYQMCWLSIEWRDLAHINREKLGFIGPARLDCGALLTPRKPLLPYMGYYCVKSGLYSSTIRSTGTTHVHGVLPLNVTQRHCKWRG